jgi:hypothetical protein
MPQQLEMEREEESTEDGEEAMSTLPSLKG